MNVMLTKITHTYHWGGEYMRTILPRFKDRILDIISKITEKMNHE